MGLTGPGPGGGFSWGELGSPTIGGKVSEGTSAGPDLPSDRLKSHNDINISVVFTIWQLCNMFWSILPKKMLLECIELHWERWFKKNLVSLQLYRTTKKSSCPTHAKVPLTGEKGQRERACHRPEDWAEHGHSFTHSAIQCNSPGIKLISPTCINIIQHLATASALVPWIFHTLRTERILFAVAAARPDKVAAPSPVSVRWPSSLSA